MLLSRSSPEINSMITANHAKGLIQNNASLILFYGASWCPYTQDALKYWNAAMEDVDKNSTTEIHQLECGNGECECFGVSGVPQIIYYRNGQKEIYDDGRSKEAYSNFLKIHANNN